MDNICFIVNIRSRICQSGVPLITDNTYTNLSNNTRIILSNGYVLTIYRVSNNRIRLSFVNETFNLSFFFDVENGSTNVFDLPIEGGTFRILVFAIMRCCETQCN